MPVGLGMGDEVLNDQIVAARDMSTFIYMTGYY